MKIWRNIEIQWRGETYSIRPSLEFLNHIEQQDGCSIGKLFIRAQNQDLPVGLSCQLIARALSYSGAKVTADDVFEATGGLSAECMQMAMTILIGCMPESQGQPDTPKKKAKTAS
jgi:hypothetical protein